MQDGKPLRDKARGAACPGGTQPAEEVISSSGITFHLWRLYQHAWLMWPHPASQGAHLRARSRISFLLFVALSVLMLVFSLVDGPAWLWLFIGVSAIAGLLLPMRSAFAAIVLFTLLPLFITLGTHGGIAGVNLWWLTALMLPVRGLGLDMIGIARMGSAIRELHTARRELARQTLREVREAVAGYRQPNPSSELEGACQLLEAAGINYQIEPNTLILPPETCDPDHLWTQRLFAPSNGERRLGVPAQGRPGSRTRRRLAPRDGRRAGG